MSLVFKEVSRKIAEGILSNSMPWQVGGIPPMAVKDGKLISGVNYLLLSQAGYADPRWTSVSEAKKRGWTLAANESDRIGLFSTSVVDRSDSRQLAAIRLVNYSQLNGPEPFQSPENHPADTAKVLIANIMNSGEAVLANPTELGKPEYSDGKFLINLPKADAANYGLNVWNAELMFAITEFGFAKLSPDNSVMDDMVKHVAHTMLCAEYGISVDSFISSTFNKEEAWINNITKDEKYVFRVAKAANQLCDYVNQFTPAMESDYSLLSRAGQANAKLFESDAVTTEEHELVSSSDLMDGIIGKLYASGDASYADALLEHIQTNRRLSNKKVN